MRYAFAAVLFAFASVAACSHDHEEEPFDTYQECFDDHHNGAESLGVQESIVICCLEHPIAGHTEVCGATATEISAACTDYVTQKGM